MIDMDVNTEHINLELEERVLELELTNNVIELNVEGGNAQSVTDIIAIDNAKSLTSRAVYKNTWQTVGININWFGVHGDFNYATGAGTDDSAIIQSAINLLYDLGGGILTGFQKRCGYLLNSPIDVKKNVVLKGVDKIDRAQPDGQRKRSMPTFIINHGAGSISNPSPFNMYESSGLHGFAFFYPAQVHYDDVTTTTPVVYPFTINCNTSQYVDNISFSNLFSYNSYRFIDCTSAGRFQMDYIYGQPLETGIKIDQIRDKARMSHVHFWVFEYVGENKMQDWIRANGTAFDIYQCDGITAVDLFGFGYYKTFSFKADINGQGAWIDLYGADADQSTMSLYVECVNKVSFFGGSLICNNTINPIQPTIVTTGSLPGSHPNNEGNLSLIGGDTFGGGSVPAVMGHSDGVVSFTDYTFKNIRDGYLWGGPIVSGDGKVYFTGCRGLEGDSQRMLGIDSGGELGSLSPFIIGGGANVWIDGLRQLGADTDVTPANFNMASWSGGKPVGWNQSFGGVDTSLLEQTTGGIIISCKGDGVSHSIDFRLPDSLKVGSQFLLFEFNLEKLTTNSPIHTVSVKIGNDDGTHSCYYKNSIWPLEPGRKVRLRFPAYINQYDGVLTFILGTYSWFAGALTKFKLTDFKVWKSDFTKYSNVEIESTVKKIDGNPYGKGYILPNVIDPSSFPILVEDNTFTGLNTFTSPITSVAPDETTRAAWQIRQSNATNFGWNISLDQNNLGELMIERVEGGIVTGRTMEFYPNGGGGGIINAPNGLTAGNPASDDVSLRVITTSWFHTMMASMTASTTSYGLVKQMAAITDLDTGTATLSDVATKVNSIMAEMRAKGILHT